MQASDLVLRVVIVEDEPLGYRRLHEALSRSPGVHVVGWARNAADAVAEIRAHRPNVVFLDIEMPGASGIDLVRSLGRDEIPRIVFVTAHSHYAVDAFNLHAVDYLLKPYTNERVEEALSRVRVSVATGTLLYSLAPQVSPVPPTPETAKTPVREITLGEYLSRISVNQRGKLRVIPVSSIDYIHAAGVYAELHVAEERLLVRESLSALERKLDPTRFCRIHRSAIVALDAVETYVRGAGGYFVQMKTGAELPVGRSYRKELERRLGRL